MTYSASGYGGVYRFDLTRKSGTIAHQSGTGPALASQFLPPTHGHTERCDGGNEDEGATFAGSGHAPTIIRTG